MKCGYLHGGIRDGHIRKHDYHLYADSSEFLLGNAEVEEEEEIEEEDDEDEEVDGIGEFKSTLPLEFEEEQAMIHASVRKYVVPKINMNATSYPDLIDWEQTKFSEPPLTLHLSDEEIKGFIQIPFSPPEIPCHTQADNGGSHFSGTSRQEMNSLGKS